MEEFLAQYYEAETPANVNTNYFLGITSTGFIGADFEDKVNGGNHPVWGTTMVPVGEWHHIAATYDGQTWKLYLDGEERSEAEARLAVRAAVSRDPDAKAIIGADRSVSHGRVVEVIDLVKGEGLAKFAIDVQRDETGTRGR
jgi:hypothetical protein